MINAAIPVTDKTTYAKAMPQPPVGVRLPPSVAPCEATAIAADPEKKTTTAVGI
jgi:hypothetical protein